MYETYFKFPFSQTLCVTLIESDSND